ncbi:unnamed protein product [Gadus morhua 'NCC']
MLKAVARQGHALDMQVIRVNTFRGDSYNSACFVLKRLPDILEEENEDEPEYVRSSFISLSLTPSHPFPSLLSFLG